MAGYLTPAWVNDAAPAIDAASLIALGEAAELGEHPYGVCSTAAATAAKTVTIDFSGTLALFTGLTVRVKFTNANTAANPTLNVNGTGAVPIMAFGSTNAPLDAWDAGQVVELTYDGTNWQLSKPTSASASLTTKANKADLTDIFQTSPTCTEANGIRVGVYFYLDNVLVQAITTISYGATFTPGTNYTTVTAGALNDLKSAFSPVLLGTTTFTTFDSSNKPTISLSEAISNYSFISVVLVVNTTEQGATTIPVDSNLRSASARVEESASTFGFAIIANLHTLEATVFNFYSPDAVWTSSVPKKINIYGIGKN